MQSAQQGDDRPLGTSRPIELDAGPNESELKHPNIPDRTLGADAVRFTRGGDHDEDRATDQLGWSKMMERDPNSECREIADRALSPSDGGRLIFKKTEPSKIYLLTWYAAARPHCASSHFRTKS